MILWLILQSALGWEHQTELSKHGSQIDAAKGFGGKYGVQTDRQDKVLCLEAPTCISNAYQPLVLHANLTALSPGQFPAFQCCSVK